MAEQLIESLSTDFDPSAYRDEYREQLLALIERKAEGKEIVAADAEEPRGDQSAGPDGGAGGEHRRGQGQDAATAKAKPAPKRKPKAPSQESESGANRRKAPPRAKAKSSK